MIEAVRGARLGGQELLAHWLCMNCTKMPPSTTIWSPGLQARRQSRIGRRRDHPGSRAAARSCRRRCDDIDERQVLVVAQDRRHRHQQPGALPGARGSARGRTSAS